MNASIVLAQSEKKIIAIGLTIICFLTRLLAMPASLWEWDDLLFAGAIHEFDLLSHSPHPPGYPVYVMLARAAYSLIGDEHLALVSISLLFSSLLAAVLFYLYDEIFNDRIIAVSGALIASFLPNVWVYSLAPRSDSPALVIGVLCLFLALKGKNSKPSLILGCALLGVGMGVRVTLLPVVGSILALVLLSKVKRRQRKIALASSVIVGLGVLVWLVPLIVHTGWQQYRYVMMAQTSGIFSADSLFAFHSVLSERLYQFGVSIWGSSWIMFSMYGLSLVGLVILFIERKQASLQWLALSFVPYMIFTFVVNTPEAAVLYSLPYVPLFAALAACGLVMSCRSLSQALKKRVLRHAGMAITAIFALSIAWWSLPILHLIRRNVSPPVQAAFYILRELESDRDIIYYQTGFSPHVRFYLPQFKFIEHHNLTNAITNLLLLDVKEELRAHSQAELRSFAYAVTSDVEGRTIKAFHWPEGTGRDRLKILSRNRYFDAYVVDLTETERRVFSSGWYRQERLADETWRWMSGRGQLALLAVSDAMILRFRAQVPSEFHNEENAPTVIFSLDDKEIARIRPVDGVIDEAIKVYRNDRRLWSLLSIETDKTIVPSQVSDRSDDRELGLQCFELEWKPAPESTPIFVSAKELFVRGWHDLEIQRGGYWRWTEKQALFRLPNVNTDMELTIVMLVPATSEGWRPRVGIELQARELDSFEPSHGIFAKTYKFPAVATEKGYHEFTIRTIPPTNDSEIEPPGVQVFHLSWSPIKRE